MSVFGDKIFLHRNYEEMLDKTQNYIRGIVKEAVIHNAGKRYGFKKTKCLFLKVDFYK